MHHREVANFAFEKNEISEGMTSVIKVTLGNAGQETNYCIVILQV